MSGIKGTGEHAGQRRRQPSVAAAGWQLLFLSFQLLDCCLVVGDLPSRKHP